MEYKNLGASGLKVSLCGLGTNNFGMLMSDQNKVNDVVNKALDLGINLFDTANIYGGQGTSEKMLSEALGSNRRDVIVATKFCGQMGDGPNDKGGSRGHIMKAVEDSLHRLNTDYIDLYQFHFPDPSTPIEETMEALTCLVRSGKVRYIGHSNFSGWQIAEAHFLAKENNFVPFVSAQNAFSLIDRRAEHEVVPAAERFGLGILPYFPLASGMLTGKYKRGEAAPEGTRLAAMGDRLGDNMSDRNFDIVEKLTDFAESNGHTILELAFGWLASQDAVSSVIAGATRPEQLEQNAKAVEWKLTKDDFKAVKKLLK